MKIIDLSNTLTEHAKTYPTGPDNKPESAPRVNIVEKQYGVSEQSSRKSYWIGSPWRLMEIGFLSRISSSGYTWMHYVMDSHAGTHVDAPYHFVENGLKVSEVPLYRYVNNGIILNARDRVLTPDDIRENKDKIQGRILLLYTGWPEVRQFGTEEYFFDFPTFGPEIGEAIVDAGALSVGVDTPSIDALDSHFDNHNILLPKDIVLIENLRNLDLLIDVQDFVVCAAPLKVDRGDASPVRAFAIV